MGITLSRGQPKDSVLTNENKYIKYQSILTIENDSSKCEELLNYAVKITDSIHDYDFAILICKKVGALLKKETYPSLQLSLDRKWGYCAYMKGDYETADKLYVQALSSKLLNKDIILKADVLNKAGANLQNLGVYKRAMTYYNETLEIYTKLNDQRGKAMVYINMANIFASTGNLSQSDLFFDKAAKIFLEKNLIENYSVILGNKAIVRWRLGKFEDAKTLLLKALKLNMKKIKSHDHFIAVYFNLGLIYAELKKWDSSFYYLTRAKTSIDSLHMSESLDGSYYYDLGYVYAKKGEIKKAISYYKKALNIKAGISEYRNLYNDVAELYLKSKQYDSAFIYKNEKDRIVDSIYNSEIKERAEFENKRIELLEKDYQNQIKSAEQEHSLSDLQKRNYLLLSIVIILVATVLVSFLYFKQSKLKEKKEHLQSELDFLKAQLNPHFLFNSINNIYVLLNDDKDKASEILLKFSDLLRYQLYECNVSLIHLSKELQFLENYIEFEKLRYSNKIKVKCHFENEKSHNLKIAPLLLQPFIENAFKHTPKNKGNENLIEIEVKVNNTQLVFKTTNTLNEGESSGLPGGVGLENVRKRLKLLYSNKHDLTIKTENGIYMVVLNLQLTHD